MQQVEQMTRRELGTGADQLQDRRDPPGERRHGAASLSRTTDPAAPRAPAGRPQATAGGGVNTAAWFGCGGGGGCGL